MVLESLNFVQIKNLTASFRKLFDGAAQCKSVDCSREVQVGCANIAPERRRLSR